MSLGIAIVTGAAQGIGRAISLRLASDRFDVAINDIETNKHNLDALAAEISAKGRRTTCLIADVRKEDEVQNMIECVVRELGGLDVMVANAGVCLVGTLLTTDIENWDANLDINVKGTFLCFKYAAKHMIEQGRGGRLIGASSVAGKMGHVNQIAYTSSKFAVRGIVQSAALELGRHGITVNSYAPGAIATAMCKSKIELDGMLTVVVESVRKVNEEGRDAFFEKMVAERTAVGYIGKPEDVASVVSYLVSKEAHYITGQSFSVDGGVALS